MILAKPTQPYTRKLFNCGDLVKGQTNSFSHSFPCWIFIAGETTLRVGQLHAPRRVDKAPMYTASAFCRGAGQGLVHRRMLRRAAAPNPLTPEHDVVLSKMKTHSGGRALERWDCMCYLGLSTATGNSDFVQAERKGKINQILCLRKWHRELKSLGVECN